MLVHLHTIAHILHATLPTISFELAHILYATLPTLSLVSAHILHATLPTFLPVRAYILYTTLPTFSWYLRTHAFCYAAKAFSGSCTHKFIHLCTMLCYAKKKKRVSLQLSPPSLGQHRVAIAWKNVVWRSQTGAAFHRLTWYCRCTHVDTSPNVYTYINLCMHIHTVHVVTSHDTSVYIHDFSKTLCVYSCIFIRSM